MEKYLDQKSQIKMQKNRSLKKVFLNIGMTFLSIFMFAPVITMAAGGIENPIRINSIQELIVKLLDIVIQLGVVVVVFFFVYAGFKFVTARGNPDEINTAKSILTWTAVGTVVLLGAKAITEVISNTVNELRQ